MKKYCFVFLIVGSLKQRQVLGSLNENIGNKFDERGALFNTNGKASIIIDKVTRYKDKDAMFNSKCIDDIAATKFIDLFNNRLDSEGKPNYQIDDGNPDIRSRIQRPCQVYDTFCYENSSQSIPAARFQDEQFQSHFIELNINEATDNVVITVNFPSVTNFSNETILKFYLRGREPILTRDFGGFNAFSYSVTVIIPDLKDLRLDRAEITTYMNVPFLPFVIGPRLAASNDPEVPTMLAAFASNIPLDQKEAGLTESNFYAATFIQYNICDFGLKVL